MVDALHDPLSPGVDRYVDGSYLDVNPTWHVEDSAWKARQVAAMIERHGMNPQRVCDMGCGAGQVLLELRSLLPPSTTFVGYEISPQALELARTRETDRLTFRLGNVCQDKSDTFDLLLALDVIEHVEDVFGLLRALKGRAASMLFHVPLDMNAQAIARNLIMKSCREPFGHLHYFQKETALAMFEDVGYEILDCIYTASSFAHPPQTPRDRLVQGLRRTLFKVEPDLAQRLLGGWSLLVLAH